MICQSIRHRSRSISGSTFLLNASRTFLSRVAPNSLMDSAVLAFSSASLPPRNVIANRHATKATHTYHRIACFLWSHLYAPSSDQPAHPTATVGRITHGTRWSGTSSNLSASSSTTKKLNTPNSNATHVYHRDQAILHSLFIALTVSPAAVACGASDSLYRANSRCSLQPMRREQTSG
jgi:hypothetical protein